MKGKKPFGKGQTDTFQIGGPDVGEIKKLRIGHGKFFRNFLGIFYINFRFIHFSLLFVISNIEWLLFIFEFR